MFTGIIQECGNVRIQLPKTGETSDTITVTGPKADADKAAALIRKIAEDRELSSFSVDIPAKQEYHKYLRNHADKIRRVNNVRMVFPGGEDEQMDVVTVIGKKEDVEKAKTEVEKLVKELVIISLFRRFHLLSDFVSVFFLSNHRFFDWLV